MAGIRALCFACGSDKRGGVFSVTLDNAQEYLREKGWVLSNEPVSARVLPSSPRNTVLKITTPHTCRVLKQAIGREADAAGRSRREQDCLAYLSTFQHSCSVPEVIQADFGNRLLLLSCAPENAVSLQQQLMNEDFNVDIAAAAGSLLGWVHATSHSDEEVARRFGDKRFFEEIRLDPFYTEIAAKHPRLASSIGAHAAALATSSLTFVHGEFTPENVLAEGERMFLVDCDAGHFGHPSVDTASFLADLTFLMFGAPGWKEEYLTLVLSFWNAYQASADFESESWHARSCLPHLGCLLLARLSHPSSGVPVMTPTANAQAQALAFSLIEREIPSLRVFLDILTRAAVRE
jgi:tRNA A-37 threonylcarbamoyl transferase component Bud32